jgi:hypothetical protein
MPRGCCATGAPSSCTTSPPAAGRRFPDSVALDEWFTEFLRRYPKDAGAAAALDPESLAAAAAGFSLAGSEEFEVALRMDQTAYCNYLLTETNVAHAIARGEDGAAIRGWLVSTLDQVFGGTAREVLFAGYLAHFAPA